MADVWKIVQAKKKRKNFDEQTRVCVEKKKQENIVQPVHKSGQFSGLHLNASWEQPLILFFSNWDHTQRFFYSILFDKKRPLKVTEHSAAQIFFMSPFFFPLLVSVFFSRKLKTQYHNTRM